MAEEWLTTWQRSKPTKATAARPRAQNLKGRDQADDGKSGPGTRAKPRPTPSRQVNPDADQRGGLADAWQTNEAL